MSDTVLKPHGEGQEGFFLRYENNEGEIEPGAEGAVRVSLCYGNGQGAVTPIVRIDGHGMGDVPTIGPGWPINTNEDGKAFLPIT